MFLFSQVKGEAKSQFSDTLTKIESSLFGVDYSSQNDTERLKRIEENVYGQSSSGALKGRVDKLSEDLSVDLIGKEIKPARDTFADNEEEEVLEEEMPQADSSVNYPIVDMLEKNVFSRQYKKSDIKERLANLEKKVFKKTYQNDNLSSRVDRLREMVMPYQTAQAEPDENSQNLYFPEDITTKFPSPSEYDYQDNNNYNQNSRYSDNNYNYYNQNNPFDSPSIYSDGSNLAIPLNSLEKKVLRKSYPNDTIKNRLVRLELKVFNSTFTEDDEQTRFDRVASAYQAKKSSKRYDNNKFSQHAATAMQIGAFLLMILAAVL